MDKRLALIYNLVTPTQAFELYPPEGVPAAAATYSVWAGYRGDDELAEFSGTATADTFSRALTAAAGYSLANRRTILTSFTTGLVVGNLYRIRNNDGQAEVVKAVTVTPGVGITTEYDLAYDYAQTSSFLEGFRQTFSPPDSFVQDESKLNTEAYPYRIRWQYTVGGIARRVLQYFDLVRHAPRDGVADEDLKDFWPDIAYLMDATRRERVLREARAVLDQDLRLRGVDPVDIAQQPIQDQLLKAAFGFVAVRSGAAIPQGYDAATALRTYTRGYLDSLELAVSGGKLMRTNNRGDDDVNPTPGQKLAFIS